MKKKPPMSSRGSLIDIKIQSHPQSHPQSHNCTKIISGFRLCKPPATAHTWLGQVNLSSQEALFSNFYGGFEQSKRKSESKATRGVTKEGHVLELLLSLLARQ
ncbi:hypothetical protein OIU77_006603 [Salix suchowensis]|uniref:Uncharacterized protein n=1 Tax=Salix suchowensis TaxID=1278906 RepID=A0ABQ9ALG9_9ROSI|nr:hypothetical protein OIU77_006603 [Salix suchowensis]